MKTLADFKRRLTYGAKLHTIYHQAFAGRGENGEYLFRDEDKGIRKISLLGSKQFALETIRTDGEVVNSYCEFPKASEFKILNENSVMILQKDFRDKNSGGTEELIPLLTYTFVE